MSIISFPAGFASADAAFDTEATRVLGEAFETAWQAVVTSGAAIADGQADAFRECLARRMIEMGRRGEWNQDRLVEDALLHLAKSRMAPDVSAPCSGGLVVSPPQSSCPARAATNRATRTSQSTPRDKCP